ncbi:small membrane protein [Klebsiella indica]
MPASTRSDINDTRMRYEMGNLFFLGLAIVLLIISIASFMSYIRDRRRIKKTFQSRRR